jgi:hypothetical protein
MYATHLTRCPAHPIAKGHPMFATTRNFLKWSPLFLLICFIAYVQYTKPPGQRPAPALSATSPNAAVHYRRAQAALPNALSMPDAHEYDNFDKKVNHSSDDQPAEAKIADHLLRAMACLHQGAQCTQCDWEEVHTPEINAPYDLPFEIVFLASAARYVARWHWENQRPDQAWEIIRDVLRISETIT